MNPPDLYLYIDYMLENQIPIEENLMVPVGSYYTCCICEERKYNPTPYTICNSCLKDLNYER
jgi:hypothetical protein